MSVIDPIRVWKDPEYRASLSQDQLASIPDHPAGLLELRDDDLRQVAGGGGTFFSLCTLSAIFCFTKGCTLGCTGIAPFC